MHFNENKISNDEKKVGYNVDLDSRNKTRSVIEINNNNIIKAIQNIYY